MESLLTRSDARKGRVCLMLGASLLLHGGIIGIAGMWSQPEPPDHSVVLDWVDSGSGGAPDPLPVQMDTPDPSTPAPPVIDVAMPSPPLTPDDFQIYEPAQTPAPHRSTVSRSVVTRRLDHTLTTAGSASNATGNNTSSSPIGFPNAGSKANSGVWVTPHPSYPRSLLLSRPIGETTVQILTDASGQISNVAITKSTGNPALDNYTETFVRRHWHGPANASRTTEFVYQIR